MITNLYTTTEQPFPIVWDNNRISIYQFLLPYQNADKLPEIAETLPDESLDNNEFKWVDGAMDGVINHHGSSTEQNYAENMLMLLQQIKDEIIKKANQFIQQDKWLDLINENLTANNESQFSLAAELYSQYGFDAWPARFEYQKKYNGDQWNDLMQSDSISRIQQVIQLANQQYDFAKLATGPTLDDGFGEDDAHYILLLILQELNRFPEVGEDLLLIALKSPLIRHRTMALNAIKAWDRSLWSDKIKTAIQELAIIEPDDEIKEDLAALIAEMND